MDRNIDFDVRRLHESLRSVDHALIRFTPAGITERIFIDFRTSEIDGPAVLLLPQAGSLAERLKSIDRARPRFPRPDRINVITWPLHVPALDRLGVVGTIRERLVGMDAFEALRQLDETYARLLRLEREELRRAIIGKGYRTLWPPVKQV